MFLWRWCWSFGCSYPRARCAILLPPQWNIRVFCMEIVKLALTHSVFASRLSRPGIINFIFLNIREVNVAFIDISSVTPTYVRDVRSVGNVANCDVSRGVSRGTINKSEIHRYAHGSSFFLSPSRPVLFGSVEKSFARKRNRIYSARVQMWRVSRQGERKIFPRFFANANESATWQATGLQRRFPAYGNVHRPIIRVSIHLHENFGHIAETKWSQLALSIWVINRGRLWICVVSFNDRSNCMYRMTRAWITYGIHNRDPRLVIFLACMLHYSAMFFIAIHWQNAEHSLRHFSSSRSPGSLIIIRNVRSSRLPAATVCKRRAVLCFSRDANHEIPLDKLIYFSRCFSLFEIYGLMYSILSTASPFKKYTGGINLK